LFAAGKAIEVAVTTGSLQLFLAAATAVVCCVPRLGHRAAADAVEVPDYRCAFAIRSPVVAGVCRGGTVGIGAGQNVVLVRRVANAVDRAFLLGDRVMLVQQHVAVVQVIDATGNELAIGVVPGAAANAYFRVDAAGTGGAQVGAPGFAGGAGGFCQGLAVCFGTGKAAEVGTVAFTDARGEAAHAGVLRWLVPA